MMIFLISYLLSGKPHPGLPVDRKGRKSLLS